MVDPLSIGIGIIAGAGVTFVALRKRPTAPPVAPREHELTTAWRLSELGDPVLVARDVADVGIPAGTPVLASGLVEPGVQTACEVREVPEVRAEFALDRTRRRSLVFLGGVQAGSLAMLTADAAMFERLHNEFKRLQDRSGEYVERCRIADLAGRTGVTIETEGFVQDVLPYKERFMMRLEDGGAIIGVLVDKDPGGLVERRVRVKGSLRKDATGYSVVEASELRPIG